MGAWVAPGPVLTKRWQREEYQLYQESSHVENKLARRIFEHMREKLTSQWRK
jgi:hypothetical protein